MSKAADDYDSIAKRLKELEADRQLALTGSSAPVQESKIGEYTTGWPYTAAADYEC
jgi:hypothetical protein